MYLSHIRAFIEWPIFPRARKQKPLPPPWPPTHTHHLHTKLNIFPIYEEWSACGGQMSLYIWNEVNKKNECDSTEWKPPTPHHIILWYRSIIIIYGIWCRDEALLLFLYGSSSTSLRAPCSSYARTVHRIRALTSLWGPIFKPNAPKNTPINQSKLLWLW